MARATPSPFSSPSKYLEHQDRTSPPPPSNRHCHATITSCLLIPIHLSFSFPFCATKCCILILE
ncbi:hypothetical protein HKD37_07G018312 [Glycine soja]